MFVVLILTFFSMLFWSFFEQAGSSLNNFTDRNVDRVFEDRKIEMAEVGETIRIQPTQEQLGYHNGDKLFTLTDLDALREKNESPDFQIDWKVHEDNVGMGVAQRIDEIPASTYQALNPIYILLLGLAFTALWAFLGARNLEPNTAVKFSLGLLQLGFGFTAFWYGAKVADARGMAGMEWLFIGYLLQTCGELCLSPVGLAMVVRLSPAKIVSTVMGSWFLATAFSQFLAAIIAQFTGVSHEEGAAKIIPPPIETVNLYGGVFGKIAIAAMVSAGICFLLSPLLSRWMHPDVVPEKTPPQTGH
jgi:POT family proton-dependent oligopeptide transporter